MTEAILAAVWIRKVRVVENVEELSPELRSQPLSKVPVLRQGYVEVAEAGVAERVASHVAELPEGRRNHDRAPLCVAAE